MKDVHLYNERFVISNNSWVVKILWKQWLQSTFCKFQSHCKRKKLVGYKYLCSKYNHFAWCILRYWYFFFTWICSFGPAVTLDIAHVASCSENKVHCFIFIMSVNLHKRRFKDKSKTQVLQTNLNNTSFTVRKKILEVKQGIALYH